MDRDRDVREEVGSRRGAARVAVLVSGEGSNLQALIDAAAGGALDASIAVVVSNRAAARGLERAREAGIPAEYLGGKGIERAAYDAALAAVLGRYAPDVVVLAGFMRICTPALVDLYAGRMLNIHPSLLPAFTGLHTHQRAIDAGCRFAGATVHEVTAELDHGPILAQAVVPILPGDQSATLAARVLSQEHRIYAQAVAQRLQGLNHQA